MKLIHTTINKIKEIKGNKNKVSGNSTHLKIVTLPRITLPLS